MSKDKLINDYIAGLGSALSKLPIRTINDIADLFMQAYEKENTIFTMGNGGHASTASHFVNDFLKHTIVSDEKNTIAVREKRFRALCLNDNISTITAWANDISFENVFSEQLINWVKRGDLVLGFSASGNSKNIIKAFEVAKKYDAKSIAFIGEPGGKMKDLADISFIVPSNNYLFIEDIHLIVNHLICNLVRAIIQKKI